MKEQLKDVDCLEIVV